jgi:hypothetical protein
VARKLGKVAVVAGVAGVTAWLVAAGVCVYRDAVEQRRWDFGW